MALLRSVRNLALTDGGTPDLTPVSYFQAPVSPAVSRATHCHSPGKGSSSPHLWVSTDTWITLGCPLCPEADSISHRAHPSCSLACPAHALPRLALQQRWPLGFSSGQLVAFLRSPCGAWHSGVRIPEPGAHWALVLLPLHPPLLILEPCLELNRAPTLSFLGHAPIGCPWGNRVTEGIC